MNIFLGVTALILLAMAGYLWQLTASSDQALAQAKRLSISIGCRLWKMLPSSLTYVFRLLLLLSLGSAIVLLLWIVTELVALPWHPNDQLVQLAFFFLVSTAVLVGIIFMRYRERVKISLLTLVHFYPCEQGIIGAKIPGKMYEDESVNVVLKFPLDEALDKDFQQLAVVKYHAATLVDQKPLPPRLIVELQASAFDIAGDIKQEKPIPTSPPSPPIVLSLKAPPKKKWTVSVKAVLKPSREPLRWKVPPKKSTISIKAVSKSLRELLGWKVLPEKPPISIPPPIIFSWNVSPKKSGEHQIGFVIDLIDPVTGPETIGHYSFSIKVNKLNGLTARQILWISFISGSLGLIATILTIVKIAHEIGWW